MNKLAGNFGMPERPIELMLLLKGTQNNFLDDSSF
jgi:hypothetical protein